MGIFGKLFKKKEEEAKAFDPMKEVATDNVQEEAKEETATAETPAEPSTEAQPQQQEPAAEPAAEVITTEDRTERAKKLAEANELFILLSVSQANMLEGYSFPYRGVLEDGSLTLYLFSTYEKAQQFVLGSDYEVLDNVYPIGKLTKEDQFSTLINTLIIANKIMNVGKFSIDETESYSIAEFLEMLDVKEYQVRIHLTNQEAEQAKAEAEKAKDNKAPKPQQMPRRFNPVQIANFTNPFIIPEERRKQLLDSIFVKEGETWEVCFRNFTEKQTLTENCFLLTILFLNYMPQAQKAGNEADLNYFAEVRHMLSTIIWAKIKNEKQLYTLVDPKTKEPIIHNESMCVIYSERLKYIQGNCEFVALEDDGIKKIQQYVSEKNLKAVVVDGITTTAVLDAEICTH